MKTIANPPSIQLYNLVRAGFVAQGMTMGGWCKSVEVNPTNARACLVGAWDGPKALKLRTQLIDASCIANPSSLFSFANNSKQQNAV